MKIAFSLAKVIFASLKSAYEGRPDGKRPRPVTLICREIGEALVAFANADGGELIIGIEDDGEITGGFHKDDEIKQMLDAVTTHVFPQQKLPLVYNLKIMLNDKVVLFFKLTKVRKKSTNLRMVVVW